MAVKLGRTCFCAVRHFTGILGHQAGQHTAFSTGLRVRNRVMTSHDGTSRVLTVPSMQWLKMEALIPSPANCDKGFECTKYAPIEIRRQLFRVYGHTRLDCQHIPYRSSAVRCLIIIQPIARTSRPVIWWGNKFTWSRCWFFVSAAGACIAQNMVQRIQLCLDAGVPHFQHMLWGISQRYSVIQNILHIFIIIGLEAEP